jgi:hypothetical protein
MFGTARLLWGAGTRPVAGALTLGWRAEERVRASVEDALGRASLTLLERVMASRYADEAVPRVLASGLMERALDQAFSGELVDAVADDLVRYRVVERVTERVLEEDTLDRVLAGAAESEALRNALAGALDSPGAEQLVSAALESPGVQRMVTRIIESRVVEEAVAQVVDEVIGRLPSNEAMWALIDQIAASPVVTDAITQQGTGFAEQVAGEVRAGSRNADARLERAARRLLRRRSRETAGSPSTSRAAG